MSGGRDVPSFDFDVAVVGAGPAGIAAACTSAATGAQTLLLESDATLGGNVSQALVHTICGLYFPSADHRAEFAHHGIARSFAETLIAQDAAGSVQWAGTSGYLPILPQRFAQLAAARCAASGARVETSTRLIGLMLSLDDAQPCVLETQRADGSRGAATAAFVIDTTGDAHAATLACATTESASADDLQHASFIVGIDNVDTDALGAMECARISTAVARAIRDGALPAGAASMVVRRSAKSGSVFVTVNLEKPAGHVFDPLETRCSAVLHANAVAAGEAIFEFLRRERAAFRDAKRGQQPTRVGIRETRRIVGLERLETDDVFAGRRRDDEVAVSTWPIELWESAQRLTFQPVAGPSSIPLRCLVADHPSRRLAMAGRCASASHEALGAIRVIATSMSMGEAAGAACGLAAQSRRALDQLNAAEVRDAVSRVA